MPLVPAEDAVNLRAYLQKHLRGPVTIDYFTRPEAEGSGPGRECATCALTGTLLEELAALSDRITLNVHDVSRDDPAVSTMGIDRVPAIVLRGAARGRVRSFGFPGGYELAGFLAQLIDVGNGRTDLAAETKAVLRSLARDVHIRVFVTPSCPYCPAAARLAQKMAIESDRVLADVVEVTEFPDLRERFAVRGVPKIVVNDAIEFVGAQPERVFLAQLLKALA
jgi:glutaredoxin-like protein